MQKKQELKKSTSQQGQVDKEKDLVAVGKLYRTFGVKGDLRFEFFPHMKIPEILYIKDAEKGFIPVHVQQVSKKKGLIRFKEYDTREKAKKITNKFLFLEKEKLPPLKEDEYYIYQLVGLDVYQNNKLLGKVIQVDDRLPDVLLVIKTPEGKIKHIPFINEFVKDINLDTGKMLVVLPDGWEEL